MASFGRLPAACLALPPSPCSWARSGAGRFKAPFEGALCRRAGSARKGPVSPARVRPRKGDPLQ
ncbi:hypothetical protein HMPREF0262_00584 [Clostridium sp. ATCC 29733]|nr:hypothetical protein HMPREF0262_00584 [Clostridium sp. ATCC 29733]